MKELTLNETAVLLAILSLRDNAYGVTIRAVMSRSMQKKISYGTLYSYLDQLSRKGYITKTDGDPTPERGGRRKIFYTLTRQGTLALETAYEQQKLIWDSYPEVSSDERAGSP